MEEPQPSAGQAREASPMVRSTGPDRPTDRLCRPTYIHTYTHADIHTYIHIYTHTYIHTYIQTICFFFFPLLFFMHITDKKKEQRQKNGHTYIHTCIHTDRPIWFFPLLFFMNTTDKKKESNKDNRQKATKTTDTHTHTHTHTHRERERGGGGGEGEKREREKENERGPVKICAKLFDKSSMHQACPPSPFMLSLARSLEETARDPPGSSIGGFYEGRQSSLSPPQTSLQLFS